CKVKSYQPAAPARDGFFPCWRVGLVHNDAYHFHAYPKRIELMPATFAQVVVVIAAPQVVEPDRDTLFVLGERNLERLACLAAFLHLALRFEEHRESILRLRCERQLLG